MYIIWCILYVCYNIWINYYIYIIREDILFFFGMIYGIIKVCKYIKILVINLFVKCYVYRFYVFKNV